MRAAWQRRTLCDKPRIDQPSRVCLSRSENGLGEGDRPILQFAKSGQSPTVSDWLIGSDWSNSFGPTTTPARCFSRCSPCGGKTDGVCLPEAQASVSRCMRVKCRPQGPHYRRAIRTTNARRLRSIAPRPAPPAGAGSSGRDTGPYGTVTPGRAAARYTDATGIDRAGRGAFSFFKLEQPRPPLPGGGTPSCLSLVAFAIWASPRASRHWQSRAASIPLPFRERVG